MIGRIFLGLSAAVVIIVVLTCTPRSTVRVADRSVASATMTPACPLKMDINDAITKLEAEDWAKGDQARKLLLQYSNESPSCRTEVINALTKAMDKPDLNFVTDRRSYFLWLNGSLALGKLKAVEALDLLIDHLDLNDGEFSASMSHQPAVLGVEAMGAMAVPKLKIALSQNPKRNIRLATALCLLDIGGRDATDALKEAVTLDSDPCVRHFIELSFERPTDEVIRQRLFSFRCDN